jgi:hypothetical protein
MTVTITLKKAIGLQLGDMEVQPGATVLQVLRQSHRFDTPGELTQCSVYEEKDTKELILLDKNAILDSDTDLLVVSPILGAAPMAAPGMSFREFWTAAGADLLRNLRFGWPVFLAIAGFLFLSAYGMLLLEPAQVSSYCDALYFTWVTMTTIGYGDIFPKSGGGRLLASVDGLVGIILIGVVVWIVTQSLTQNEAQDSDH